MNIVHELQGPLTSVAYAALCEERAWYCGPVPIHVQCRKDGMTHCATVVEVKQGASGLDWFRLDAGAGPIWMTGKNVRACAGAGVCHCEAAARDGGAPARGEAPARAAASTPLGNTGTTMGAGA